MAINCLLVTHSPNSGVQERRDCSVAASSTCRHFLSVRPAFHLAMERSACHGITSSTPICVAVSMACSSCPVFASAWIKASLVVGCGSLPKLDTSAIPCCASRNTAWIRSPLPSESCNSSPSFRRMAEWHVDAPTGATSISIRRSIRHCSPAHHHVPYQAGKGHQS